jgi:hypothetical protein
MELFQRQSSQDEHLAVGTEHSIEHSTEHSTKH